jgi:hypothetical protein
MRLGKSKTPRRSSSRRTRRRRSRRRMRKSLLPMHFPRERTRNKRLRAYLRVRIEPCLALRRRNRRRLGLKPSGPRRRRRRRAKPRMPSRKRSSSGCSDASPINARSCAHARIRIHYIHVKSIYPSAFVTRIPESRRRPPRGPFLSMPHEPSHLDRRLSRVVTSWPRRTMLAIAYEHYLLN